MDAVVREQEERLRQLEERCKAAEEALKKKIQSEEAKKHKFGVSNPLRFPPHLYNSTLFQINQPLVTFLKKSPSSNKVRSRRLPDEVLQHALKKALLRSFIPADRVTKSRVHEKSYKPLHQSLLDGLWFLTKPSELAEEYVHSLEEEAGFLEVEEEANDDSAHIEAEAESEGGPEPEAEVDLVVEHASEEAEVEEDQSDGSDESDENHSTSMKSLDATPEIDRKDLYVKVCDANLYRLGRIDDPWATVLVIEEKKCLSKEAMYQALSYACKEGLINLDKGRVAPIFVMQWSFERWAYSMIDIYGAVRVQAGVITDESYEDFRKHQRIRWSYLHRAESEFKLQFPKEKLQESLTQRRKLMRQKCSSEPQLDYPDGLYIVGDVFLDNRNWALPSADVRMHTNPGVLKFCEALMKIVIGRSCLKWGIGDVDAAVATRTRHCDRISSALVDPPPPKRQRLE